MNAVIQASGLGKQYRRAWALRDCTLAIPEGHVAGLVGPNGAGKTTLLRIAAGMLTPTRGTMAVLGRRPGAGRREFLQGLMEAVADQHLSAVLSSHLVADLERVCAYLVVLVSSRVRVAGQVSDLLASHRRLSGPRRDPGTLPAGQDVITESHTDKQSNLLVRTDGPVLDPAWAVNPVSLEDLVLAGQPGAWFRSSTAADAAGRPVSSVVPSACSPAASNGGPGPALADCLTSQGIRIAVTYQPASRYWPLQWTETGIYLVLSLALAGYCFRRLNRLS